MQSSLWLESSRKNSSTSLCIYIKQQDRLQHARAIMNDEHGNRETLFVAVHVRRTDYTRYLSRKGVTVTADINYYRYAVAWMLRKLTSDSESSHNIAFILASDDQVWCKTKLLPEIQEEIQSFGIKTNLGGSSVFYLGDIDTPKVDLVMLSSCNHSIIAYGTYGLWSALMANGWTVVYDMLLSSRAMTRFGAKPSYYRRYRKEIRSLGNTTNLDGSSMFYLGEEETPVVDLVMLSSCHHSIIAHGTYGIWSALMVNG
uniref:L-Fucosyltransferase n=1 Tax=Timema poppense TaxID=170557 RepID=A0A7R9D2A8_TIMPO|nr:unnamed protein product [Timema poppensis]